MSSDRILQLLNEEEEQNQQKVDKLCEEVKSDFSKKYPTVNIKSVISGYSRNNSMWFVYLSIEEDNLRKSIIKAVSSIELETEGITPRFIEYFTSLFCDTWEKSKR